MMEAKNNQPTSQSEDHHGEDEYECAVCLQVCVHPVRLPCTHIFCYLCVKGVANLSKRCAMCRQEIPTDFLERPNLLCKLDDKEVEPESYQWFYEGRNGWWQYDERTNHDLETSYSNGVRSCEVLVAGFLYTIDYDRMIQLRRNDPSRRRRIKRDLSSIPKKGVAGLKTGPQEPEPDILRNDDEQTTGQSVSSTSEEADSTEATDPSSNLTHVAPADDIVSSTTASIDHTLPHSNGTNMRRLANQLDSLNIGTSADHDESALSNLQRLGSQSCDNIESRGNISSWNVERPASQDDVSSSSSTGEAVQQSDLQDWQSNANDRTRLRRRCNQRINSIQDRNIAFSRDGRDQFAQSTEGPSNSHTVAQVRLLLGRNNSSTAEISSVSSEAIGQGTEPFDDDVHTERHTFVADSSSGDGTLLYSLEDSEEYSLPSNEDL